MNSQDLGIALTSEIIFVGNTAVGISPTVFTYIEEEAPFSNGGITPIEIGDVARGLKSNASAIVVSVDKLRGEWSNSTAEGIIRFKSRSGKFIEGEGLSVGAESDRINIGWVSACEDNYIRKNMYASRVFVSVPPTTDSLVDHAAVVISTDGSNLDRNYAMGHVIPEAKKWVLYGVDEIMKARFISFVAGSKSKMVVTAYFERL